MSLKFRYNFNLSYPGYVDIEMDYEDAEEYILRTHDLKDIIKDYNFSGLYNNLPKEDKNTLLSYDNYDGTDESVDNMSEDMAFELVTSGDVLFDLINYTDIYEDELKDYFKQEAYEIYKDSLDDEQDKKYSEFNYFIQ